MYIYIRVVRDGFSSEPIECTFPRALPDELPECMSRGWPISADRELTCCTLYNIHYNNMIFQ